MDGRDKFGQGRVFGADPILTVLLLCPGEPRLNYGSEKLRLNRRSISSLY